MSKYSFIEIDTEAARVLAADTIDRIDRSRGRMIESYINSELQRLNNGFWHKLFRQQDFTREDVLRMDSENQWGGYIHETKFIKFGNQYQTAKDILRTPKTGIKMFLSLTDYERIS